MTSVVKDDMSSLYTDWNLFGKQGTETIMTKIESINNNEIIILKNHECLQCHQMFELKSNLNEHI